jgi:hypothetical protein
MLLPPRPFHPVTELSYRWSAAPADIVAWAIDGALALSAVVPSTETAEGHTVWGLVEIAGADVLGLFRRESASTSVTLRRFKGPSARENWETIPSSAAGIEITAGDVLVAKAELERFEQAHQLGPASGTGKSRRPPGPGAPPKYEWDAFYGALARRVHDRGIPASLSELVRDMQDWFDAKGVDPAPDASTVRRRAQVIWRELTSAQKASA